MATLFFCKSHITQFNHSDFGLFWVVSYEDTTHRKETEKILRSSEILKAQETERSRISHDLHDEIGQLLVVLKMEIFGLKKMILPKQSSMSTKIIEIENSIDHLIKKVQRIAFELRPSMLESTNLEEGIKCLVNDLKSRTGRVINLDLSLNGYSAEDEISTALYRIIRKHLPIVFVIPNQKK